MAAVYDGRDESGNWYIDPDRPKIETQEERARIVNFLAGGAMIVHIPGRHEDVIDPEGYGASMSTHSDGTWIWTGAVRYYVLEHGIAPEPEFLEHIVACDYIPHEPDEAVQRQALAQLGVPSDEPDPS